MKYRMTEHNIFHEIDADLERQKLENLWKRFGPAIVLGAGLIVLVTAVYTSWNTWKTGKDQQATNGLMTAIQAAHADPTKDVDTLEAFAQKNPGTTQATFADLHAAAAAEMAGQKDKALQIYDAVAKDDKADLAFRQLADLMAVRAQMDTGNPAELDKRLQPLLGGNQPWRFSAQEYDGYLALRAGDKAKATQVFTSLSQDAAAPHSIGARAADMLRFLSE